MKLIAYTRRSTDRQELTHDAQLRAIREARPNDELLVVEDTCSGKIPFADRPGGAYAIGLLQAQRAEGLVVSKLDRLTRSFLDGADLIEGFTEEGWALIALDAGFDTSTPTGKAFMQMMLVFAELERARLSERTREAIAEHRRRNPGWVPGRDAYAHPTNVVDRIVREREHGRTLRAIAEDLNADGVRTARDATWYASTVRDILRRVTRDDA